jgi:hypothetical protein
MPSLTPLTAEQLRTPGLESAWREFGVVMNRISAALDAVAPYESFRIDGTVSGYYGLVLLADLRRKFSNISWSLTGTSFDNGGVGEVRSHWADPRRRTLWLSAEQRTNAGQFLGYALHPRASGLNYLALHETAHVTELGIRTWSQCWDEHKARGGTRDDYPNTPQWTRNEAVANTITRMVCARLGLQCLNNPNGGFLR